VKKYEDIVMPEQHRHLVNKYKDTSTCRGQRHIVAATAYSLLTMLTDITNQKIELSDLTLQSFCSNIHQKQYTNDVTN